MNKRAACYARVSTDKQRDENTIDTQLHEMRAEIEKDGNVLIEDCIYKDEGWSGAFLERPDLDRLRQDAKENKFGILYVFDRGRLSRIFLHQEIVLEEFQKYGIEFKSLHDINGITHEEQLMGKVMGIFAEYERTKISERFRLGKLNKVRNGNLLGYNPAYGYDYVPVKGKGLNKKNGYFVINKQEAEVVRMIFDWVGNEGVSLKEVIRRLYNLGIPPKKQRRPNWTKGPVSRLLINETYIGKHYYYKKEAIVPKNPMGSSARKYKQKHTNKTSRKARDRSEWLMVKAPRIIDDELFERAQQQLKLSSKYNPRNKVHPYLLSGLIYCACGERRVGDGPDGKKYYRCTARLHTFPLPNPCGLGGVNVSVLDAVCWQKISTLLTDPKLVEEQVKRYLQKQPRKADNKPSVTNIQYNLKALDNEERRYAKMYGQGMMSDDVYEEQMKSVLERREALHKLRAQPEDHEANQIRNLDPEKLVEPFKQFINDLSFQDKLFIVRRLTDKIVATKQEVTICGFIPLLSNAEAKKLMKSTNEATGKVKYGPIYRHRRPPQRR